MKILFFGALREAVGVDALEFNEPVNTVAALKSRLAQTYPEWADALSQHAHMAAVNQELAGPDHGISGADEVALFPHITGG